MSTWADQDIRLDPAIRNWVLLPITIVMLLVGILRHYLIQYLDSNSSSSQSIQSSANQPNQKPSQQQQQNHHPKMNQFFKKLKPTKLLLRSNHLRLHSNHLSLDRFKLKQSILIKNLSTSSSNDDTDEDINKRQQGGQIENQNHSNDDQDGVSKSKNDNQSNPPNPLDPSQMDGMMDGLKKQMVMMIPQTVIMGWINTFFYGFVCVKLPFPLPYGFKQMLQRGIETPEMDISWVSSLSWYFLNLFGLNPLYRLILGDGNAADGSAALAMGANQSNLLQSSALPGQQIDYKKLFQNEIENLKLIDHHFIGDQLIDSNHHDDDQIEIRILKLYGHQSFS